MGCSASRQRGGVAASKVPSNDQIVHNTNNSEPNARLRTHSSKEDALIDKSASDDGLADAELQARLEALVSPGERLVMKAVKQRIGRVRSAACSVVVVYAGSISPNQCVGYCESLSLPLDCTSFQRKNVHNLCTSICLYRIAYHRSVQCRRAARPSRQAGPA